jgi:hypothetical protein
MYRVKLCRRLEVEFEQVTTVLVPRFAEMPRVIRWGNGVFVLDSKHGRYYEESWVDVTSEDQYRDAGLHIEGRLEDY